MRMASIILDTENNLQVIYFDDIAPSAREKWYWVCGCLSVVECVACPPSGMKRGTTHGTTPVKPIELLRACSCVQCLVLYTTHI